MSSLFDHIYGWKQKILSLVMTIGMIFNLIHTTEVCSIKLPEKGAQVVVESGTTEDLIFDCPYILDLTDEGLVVKWYYNDDHIAFYQWIPEEYPQVLPFLQESLDTNYTISSVAKSKYRALRFLNPTTKFSGTFTCRVACFNDEKNYSRNLLVYLAPSDFKISTWQNEKENVTVSCNVGGAYPEPDVSITRSSLGGRKSVNTVSVERTWSHGLYNVSLRAELKEADLEQITSFVCHLNLPDTPVKMNTATNYQRRNYLNQQFAATSGMASNTSIRRYLNIIIPIPLMLFIIIYYTF